MIKNKIVKYYARKDSNIALKVIPGHFVTNHSHLNYYLDMTTMKTRQNEAERIAIAMKDYYNVMDKPIDTIVCLDGCEVIGAFLASELSRSGVLSTNAHKTIYVVTPEFNSNGQMIFRDNLKPESMERTFFCFLLQQQQERLSATALNALNITVAFFRVSQLSLAQLIQLTDIELMHYLEQMIFLTMKHLLTVIVQCVRKANL